MHIAGILGVLFRRRVLKDQQDSVLLPIAAVRVLALAVLVGLIHCKYLIHNRISLVTLLWCGCGSSRWSLAFQNILMCACAAVQAAGWDSVAGAYVAVDLELPWAPPPEPVVEDPKAKSAWPPHAVHATPCSPHVQFMQPHAGPHMQFIQPHAAPYVPILQPLVLHCEN